MDIDCCGHIDPKHSSKSFVARNFGTDTCFWDTIEDVPWPLMFPFVLYLHDVFVMCFMHVFRCCSKLNFDDVKGSIFLCVLTHIMYTRISDFKYITKFCMARLPIVNDHVCICIYIFVYQYINKLLKFILYLVARCSQ